MSKIVTIFGSSYPKPGEIEYEDAYFFGRELGKSGFDVCSGGHMGIMDAVSKGAVDSGRNAIGITLDVFSSKPSKHLTKQIKCKTLFERITQLIYTGDAYLILNGGTGTLLELSAVWEFLNKGFMKTKPVCAYGKIWNGIIKEIDSRLAEESKNIGLVKYFEDKNKCARYLVSELN